MLWKMARQTLIAAAAIALLAGAWQAATGPRTFGETGYGRIERAHHDDD